MHGEALVVALAVLAFGLVAGRLRGTSLTMPMVFTAAGLLLGPAVLGVLDFRADDEVVSVLAEVTLAVVLFTDASRMDLRTVLREHDLALRLLGLGLPLAIAVGTVVGVVLLPDLPVAVVAVLAAVLAPTDAALGQAFVEDESVPARVRQTLNVESGLNDGLAVPFVTVLLDVARSEAEGPTAYLGLFASLVGLGVAIGMLTGWLGGRALTAATARGWTTPTTQRLGSLALAAVAFTAAELVGGNGFVATFTAGLAVGSSARSLLPATGAFAQAEGQLLTLLTFLLFGAVIVGDLLADTDWRVVVYALASLFLVRPVAVALALLGSRLRLATVAFIAWGGPRGLASLVYAVLVIATPGVPGAELVFTVAGWTILLSIFLHGLSAAPLSRRYGARMQHADDQHRRNEHRAVTHLPVRHPREPAARQPPTTRPGSA